mgnify:CR=1 FL=1
MDAWCGYNPPKGRKPIEVISEGFHISLSCQDFLMQTRQFLMVSPWSGWGHQCRKLLVTGNMIGFIKDCFNLSGAKSFKVLLIIISKPLRIGVILRELIFWVVVVVVRLVHKKRVLKLGLRLAPFSSDMYRPKQFRVSTWEMCHGRKSPGTLRSW